MLEYYLSNVVNQRMDPRFAARKAILPASREEALRLLVKHTGGSCAPNSVPTAEDLAAASRVLQAKTEAAIQTYKAYSGSKRAIMVLEAAAAGFARNPFR